MKNKFKWKVVNFIGETMKVFVSYKAANNYVMKHPYLDLKLERSV